MPSQSVKAAAVRKNIQRNRIRHTRWLVVLFLPLLAFVAPSVGRPPWVSEALENAGIICLLICLIGRGWTSIYISGRKNRELVDTGPFSVVRNPLYVFSFIGVVGMGLVSELVTLLVVSVLVFCAYYAIVVRNEEAYMAQLHGDAYARYFRTVPRWFPKFFLWRDAAIQNVQPRTVLIHLRDSALFFLSFFFFETLEYMRVVGGYNPLIHLP